MLERRKRRLDSSVVVGVLLAAGVSVLPMCDACHEAADADVFADLGMGSSGPSALWPCVLWLAIGTAIVFVVGKLAHRARNRSTAGTIGANIRTATLSTAFIRFCIGSRKIGRASSTCPSCCCSA